MENKPSDKTIGIRGCLLCGVIYEGKHTKCPHESTKIFGKNTELINIGRIMSVAEGC